MNEDDYIHSLDGLWKIRVGSIFRLEIHENVEAQDEFRFYLVIVILTGGLERNILFEKYEKREEAEARRANLLEQIGATNEESKDVIV